MPESCVTKGNKIHYYVLLKYVKQNQANEISSLQVRLYVKTENYSCQHEITAWHS